jgi:hypothetical protein
MTDELDELAALVRPIEPLPGGVFALRRRLRAAHAGGGARRGVAWLAALTAACAIVVAWQVRPREPRGDHAIDRLYQSDTLPHPDAVALGLVGRPPTEQLVDPRVGDDRVVFRWVDGASNRSTFGAEAAPIGITPIDPRDPTHQLDPR